MSDYTDRDRIDPSRYVSQINRIENAVQQLLQMLDDMLLIVKMESGKFLVRPETIAVGEFIQAIVDDFQTICGLSRPIHFEAHGIRSIVTDSRLLRYIANNLISNAIKYSRDESTIYVRLTLKENSLILQVQDEGIGIAEDDLKHLFDSFHRGKNVGSIAGNGLGLNITKHAVERLNGSIQIESQMDIGTVFTVSLPVSHL